LTRQAAAQELANPLIQKSLPPLRKQKLQFQEDVSSFIILIIALLLHISVE